MKKITVFALIMLFIACSKSDDTEQPKIQRTEFSVSATLTPNVDTSCDHDIAISRWHDGENEMPVVGDKCYIHATLDMPWNTNDLYAKMPGDKAIKTDENGVVTEILDCY